MESIRLYSHKIVAQASTNSMKKNMNRFHAKNLLISINNRKIYSRTCKEYKIKTSIKATYDTARNGVDFYQ